MLLAIDEELSLMFSSAVSCNTDDGQNRKGGKGAEENWVRKEGRAAADDPQKLFK